jgi:fluoride exporter
MPLWVWLGVGVLGGFFAIARFLVDAIVSSRVGSEFPWGTFTVNISGSLVLGILFGAGVNGRDYVLAGSACVGAYTTFSTWMLESYRLGEDDDRRPLLAYVLGSLVIGLLAAALGRILGEAL